MATKEKPLALSDGFFLGLFKIHTASAPSTAGTHTDGGAVMRRTGIAEERHY